MKTHKKPKTIRQIQIQPEPLTVTTARPRPQPPSTRPNQNPTQGTTHKLEPSRHQNFTKPSSTRPHTTKPRAPRAPTRSRNPPPYQTEDHHHEAPRVPAACADDEPEPMGALAGTGRRGTTWRYPPAAHERAPRRFTRSWTTAAASATEGPGRAPCGGPDLPADPQQDQRPPLTKTLVTL